MVTLPSYGEYTSRTDWPVWKLHREFSFAISTWYILSLWYFPANPGQLKQTHSDRRIFEAVILNLRFTYLSEESTFVAFTIVHSCFFPASTHRSQGFLLFKAIYPWVFRFTSSSVLFAFHTPLSLWFSSSLFLIFNLWPGPLKERRKTLGYVVIGDLMKTQINRQGYCNASFTLFDWATVGWKHLFYKEKKTFDTQLWPQPCSQWCSWGQDLCPHGFIT